MMLLAQKLERELAALQAQLAKEQLWGKEQSVRAEKAEQECKGLDSQLTIAETANAALRTENNTILNENERLKAQIGTYRLGEMSRKYQNVPAPKNAAETHSEPDKSGGSLK